MSRYLSLLLVACTSSTPAPPTNTRTGPAPGPGKWTYAAEVDSEGNGKTAKHRVVLAETARKKLGGVTAIELTVEVDGVPLTEETREIFGHPPFTTITPKLWLLAKGGAVWLAFGDETPDEARVAEMTKDKATWTFSGPVRSEPAEPPMDEDYAFAKKVVTWASTCTRYIHPAPDSGDTFSSERCFAPNVGITRLEFNSVWGGYDLTLESGPTSFSVE